MKVFRGHVAACDQPACAKVTLGTFDGVHLGHQEVLRELVTWARATESAAVVVTFDRKPRDAIAGEGANDITSLPHRLLLFDRLGVDATLVLPFDESLRNMEPEAFVERILVEQTHANGVLLGHDTRFGRMARGDLALLDRLGRRMGFQTCSVKVVELDGAPVSSTRVRMAIRDANLELAERMLGRRVSVLGTVVRGTGRGAGLGFPTANLDLHHELRPPQGVYAGRTLVDGVWRDSVTNIGRAPTLRPDASPDATAESIVETHLLDFSADLYGKEIEVKFIARLRDEEVFDSPELLAAQIALDIAETRAILAQAEPLEEPGK